MRGVLAKAAADLARRRVQTAVVAIVVLLSSGAGALALSLVVLADAPFQRSFDSVNGAHLVMSFDRSKASDGQLRATGSLPAVAAAAGPFPALTVEFDLGVRRGGRASFLVEGRSDPGGPVDQVPLLAGRWPAASGEAVVAASNGMTIGDTLTPAAGSGMPELRVVGVAQTVGDPAGIWTLPGDVPTDSGGKARSAAWMYYRLRSAATDQDVTSAENAITAALPRGSVVATQSWLQVQRNVDITTSVMIPFLLAFSVFALIAAALIVASVVSGAVIAGTRDIGIMKSIGFTPAQVVAVLTLQMLAPGALGCLLGIPLGVLGSQPILAQTSQAFGLPAAFSVAPGVDAVLAASVLAVIALAAVVPALRAGRMSAVAAITRGTAPQSRGGARLSGLLAGLPVSRAAGLGAGESLARPVRSLMTVLAITIAVATVAFAIGLIASLRLVAAHLVRDQWTPVIVIAQDGSDLSQVIAAQPGTARFVPEAQVQAAVSGLVGPAQVTAVGGDSSWLGYSVIDGRWIQRPGETVATPWLLHQAHASIGDTLTLTVQGHPVDLRVVGTYLDQNSDDLLMLANLDDLTAAGARLQPSFYEVGLKPGTDPRRYAALIQQAAPDQVVDARARESSGTNSSFLLLDGVLVWVAAVLAAVGMAGVFNTVVLNTREKARTIAILKAVGMTPRQTVAMVLCSVAVLGVAGGVLGVPLGIALHHRILVSMADIAAHTVPPPPFYDVFQPLTLAALVLAGVGVALVGGWMPAGWAARARVTEVLRSE